MKINSIKTNTNNNFKRVIKVEYKQNPDFYKSKYAVKKGIIDLENTLNGKPTEAYNKNEQKQLVKFFKGFLEDTHKRSPLRFRYLPAVGYVLLTDEDALEVQNREKLLEQKNNKKILEIEEKKLGQKFTEKLEDGTKGKTKTTLKITASCENPSDKKNFTKIDTFDFFEIKSFYTSMRDGYIHDDLGTKTKPSKVHNTKNINAKRSLLTLA